MNENNDLHNFLVECMQYIYAIVGSNQPNIEDVYFIISELEYEIQVNYKNLTKEEIKYALKQGAYERYGSFYTISLSRIIMWLDAYLKSEDRRKITINNYQVSRLTNSPKQLKQNDTFIILQGINSTYQEYLSTGEVPIQGAFAANIESLYCNTLKEKGYNGNTLKDMFDNLKEQGITQLQ